MSQVLRPWGAGKTFRCVAAAAAALLGCLLWTPFAAEATPRCLGKPATVVGSGAVRGTAHADVIVATGGDDQVDGGGGNDRICTGGGDDQIAGGTGSDRVDAGPGADSVEGGNGSDWVLGGAGRDSLLGNRGNDQLFGGAGDRDFVNGGLGDDGALDGGAGDFDQVIGGVGNDKLFGGAGNGDVLRADRGGDLVDGGPGVHDTASFAVSGLGGTVLGGQGVLVDLAAGSSSQDGEDRLSGIEDVIGTPFSDVIRGDSQVNVLYGGGGTDELVGVGPGDSAFGGLGDDVCRDFATRDSCERTAVGGISPELLEIAAGKKQGGPVLEVDLAGGPAASSLTAVVRGPAYLRGKPGISVQVAFAGGAWILRQAQIPIEVGDGCVLLSAAEVSCPIAGQPDAVLIGGSGGDDSLTIDPGVPASISASIQGDVGSDLVVGGPGDDNLTGAPSDTPRPLDVVIGGAGDDALTSGVELHGGPGSDLLIASVCAGQDVDGGGGVDSVSFARQLYLPGVEARIGGIAGLAPVTHGKHPTPGGCPGEFSLQPTYIRNSIESIEGSPKDDVLIGNGSRNILLGRGGDDRLLGNGGDDFLVGGTGRDELLGGPGPDRLYARDGVRDKGIDCGMGPRGGAAIADRSDPPAGSCTVVKTG